MKPIVNGLATEFSDDVAIVWLDAAVPENGRLLLAYGLRGHPSFVTINAQGDIVTRLVGPQSETALREALRAVQLD